MSGGFVGVMTADLHLPVADSLKEKRKPLAGLRAALIKATGCSVAEVGDHDVLRRAKVSLTVVAVDAPGATRLLDMAERVIWNGPFEVLATARRLLSVDEVVHD
jgi:uncharacterized protein YlxP (DUF503 family)